MARKIVAFLSGVIFSVGLAFAGMTMPQRVIGFLDVAHWDPTLLWVMASAILVHATAYHFVIKRRAPILDGRWHIPQRKDLGVQLFIGSILFGFGWGLGGYCPGPAVVSIVTGRSGVFIFLIAAVIGIRLHKLVQKFI